ncbi:ESF2/ABP1 family protein [Pelomyxa schiedti]|nr:ESF2/ABP1 family protein [Pelomyxa schiedti]
MTSRRKNAPTKSADTEAPAGLRRLPPVADSDEDSDAEAPDCNGTTTTTVAPDGSDDDEDARGHDAEGEDENQDGDEDEEERSGEDGDEQEEPEDEDDEDEDGDGDDGEEDDDDEEEEDEEDEDEDEEGEEEKKASREMRYYGNVERWHQEALDKVLLEKLERKEKRMADKAKSKATSAKAGAKMAGSKRLRKDEGEDELKETKKAVKMTERLAAIHAKSGIVFVGTVPPKIHPGGLVKLLRELGTVLDFYFVGRTIPSRNGKGFFSWKHGWVLFANKTRGKNIAEQLNNTPITYKHGEHLWNLKYLPGFKWDDLMERLRKDTQLPQHLKEAAAQKAADYANFYLNQPGRPTSAQHAGSNQILRGSHYVYNTSAPTLSPLDKLRAQNSRKDIYFNNKGLHMRRPYGVSAGQWGRSGESESATVPEWDGTIEFTTSLKPTPTSPSSTTSTTTTRTTASKNRQQTPTGARPPPRRTKPNNSQARASKPEPKKMRHL